LKKPWANRTGAAKFVAIFSTSLGIALGLCGLNFVGVLGVDSLSGSGSTIVGKVANVAAAILGIAGWLELLTILISLLGLLIAWLLLSFTKDKAG